MEGIGGVILGRGVAVLGSTGSIGQSALDVLESLPEEFEVVALAAGQNVDLLAEQMARFKPRYVSVADKEKASVLKADAGGNVRIGWGEDALIEAATWAGVDIVLVAVVGAIGIRPTLAAIEAGTKIALANKETLVAAGDLVVRALEASSATMVPVDSEHSAIHQCLNGAADESIERLILTASGGPFREVPGEAMAKARPEDALKHPTWNMGGKITIDSATLMNKGLEVIEAHWLFAVDFDRIDVVVHPQSIVHSMVEFNDGSVLAQMGVPDMRIPIQYALCHPRRRSAEWGRFSPEKVGTLTFEPPDRERFPCLNLAYEAGRTGGTAPTVLNAANEVAVEAFLSHRCRFTDIAHCVEDALASHESRVAESVEGVLDADRWARQRAREFVARLL